MVLVLHLKLFVTLFALMAVNYEAISAEKCQRSFICGKVTYSPILPPLRLQDDPASCGDPDLELSCDTNHQAVLNLGSNRNKYYVKEVRLGISSFASVPIFTGSYLGNFIAIRILDPGLVHHDDDDHDNCSTPFPRYSFKGDDSDDDLIVFLSCKKQIKSPRYGITISDHHFNKSSCGNFDESLLEPGIHRYVLFGKVKALLASDIEDSCTIFRTIRSTFSSLDDLANRKRDISYQDIHDAIITGYELHWLTRSVGSSVIMYKIIPLGCGLIVMITSVRGLAGIIILCGYLYIKRRPKHASIYANIEKFLQDGNIVVPIRYSFRHIKKMTNNFTEKLGEGGYGTVYKGKLRSGQLIAVKMLTAKKNLNGNEFINEVATLGRIHHVNVVRLVGFCATTTKNALIYEYMSNGSLDKYIFSHNTNGSVLMMWRKLHAIAVGVTRGVEYLHQGCNMQILHFDIKPHNILLDENFVPKVSDFGLAKLRPVKNDVVTMTAVRGTLGYMAPELFYKRVGEVTCKADVYSFGMLLMEIAGRRKNVNSNAEHSSQVYFPSWIYDQFEQGHNLIHDDDDDDDDVYYSEEEMEISRKLILTAFWCIQMTPNDRPSMKKVLEMLIGDSGNLQLPPKSQFYPPHPPAILDEQSCFSFVDDETTESSLEIQVE